MVRSRILRCLLLVVAVSSRIFDVALASTEQGIIQNTDSNSASSNFYESFEKQALRQKFQDKSSSQPVDPRNSKETGNFQDVLKELCKQRKSIFNEFATEPIDDERQLLSLKKLKNRKTTASLQSKQGPEGSVAPEDSIDSAVEGLPVNEVDKL